MKQMAAEAAYVSVKHIHVYRFALFLFSGFDDNGSECFR